MRATYVRIGNIDGVSQLYDLVWKPRDLNIIFACRHGCGYATVSKPLSQPPSHTQTLPETTTQEAMSEVHKLKKDFETRDTHQTMVVYDNFHQASVKRETGKPERGYGSVLPTHRPEHGMRLDGGREGGGRREGGRKGGREKGSYREGETPRKEGKEKGRYVCDLLYSQ